MHLTRRSFLQSNLVAAGAMALSRPGFAAPASAESQGMKLGLVTYNWGKDYDLPGLIGICTDAGISGIELRSTHKHGVEINLSKEQRQEVRKRFADSPVEFVGPGSACEYHSNNPDELRKNIEETKAFVKLSHDCGGSGVKVRPNGLVKGAPIEKTIEQIGLSLLEVSKFAADYGQEIRLEVHGKETSSVPLIHKIMQVADHPQARVCWNCNSSDLDGDGLEANFKLVADRIGTVHIHDLRKKNYPWPELFALLKGTHFKGWTLIEEGNAPDNVVNALKENREIWKELTA